MHPKDEFDRMADRMMKSFGMPKMDLSKIYRIKDFYNSDAV